MNLNGKIIYVCIEKIDKAKKRVYVHSTEKGGEAEGERDR